MTEASDRSRDHFSVLDGPRRQSRRGSSNLILMDQTRVRCTGAVIAAQEGGAARKRRMATP